MCTESDMFELSGEVVDLSPQIEANVFVRKQCVTLVINGVFWSTALNCSTGLI